MLILVDFQNGDLGFGSGQYIYILDRQTLALKQRLTNIYPMYDVVAFNVFVDSKLSQRRILVHRGFLYHTEVVSDLKIDKKGNYVETFAFFYRVEFNSYNRALDLYLS